MDFGAPKLLVLSKDCLLLLGKVLLDHIDIVLVILIVESHFLGEALHRSKEQHLWEIHNISKYSKFVTISKHHISMVKIC